MRNNLYRFLTILCLFTLGISTLFAVPAYRGWQTVSQPDGSTITIRQMGDEFFHYWENEAGQQVEEDAQGYWHVLETPVVESQLQKKMRASRHYTQVKKSGQPAKVGGINLAPRGLVILVNFSDVAYQSYNTKAAMSELMNSEDYTYNSATGSVREFFKAQSNGQYVPDFDVVGPYTLNHTRAYYGANDASGNDVLAGDMIVEACKAADADGVDFTKYNNDGDTYVDFVYVIYAGVGEADANPKVPNSIWPHNWTIDGARYWGNCTYTASQCKVDGLTINNYACSGELTGNASNRCPIGTITHEFGHVLGLPDYYVTDEDATNEDKDYTPGAWHIMDYGSYNNNGRTPPNYTPHDKYFFGWATPTLLAKNEKKNCTLTTTYGSAYQINGGTTLKTAKAESRVWYLENRQKSGWDKYLPGHGMVVWEVTYNSTDWDNNEPNNENVGYTLVTANSLTRPYTPCVYSTTASSTSGTPFPGTSHVTSYTPATGCALTEITESGGNITFKYNGGVIKTTCTYEFVTDHCTAPADGSVALNAPLSITITPATGYSLADASCWTVEMGGVALTYGTDFTYTPSTNTFYIASLTDDVVIMAEAKQIRTVTWSVNGATTTSTFLDGAALVLPSTPADCSGSGGKKFVGWTASSSVSGSAPADLFTSAGTKTVTANTTYYAVYATASGSGSGSFDGSTAGTYKIYAQVGDTRYYATGTGSKISSTTSADDATEYTFEAVTGGLAIKTGTTYITYSSSTNLGTSTNAYTWKFAAGTKGTWRVNSGTSGRGLIFRAGSTNQFGGYSTSNVTASGTEYYDLEIGGGGTSYSDYSTTCAACTLTGISVDASGATTSFVEGSTFSYEGIVVTASYSDCASRTVTPTSVTPPDMSVVGTGKTVTVSYTEGEVTKTATYTIDITAAPTYTIRFFDGTTKLKEESLVAGATATPPTNPEGCTENGGYTFVGWWTSNLATTNTESHTWVTDFTVSTAQDYYAVYSHTETSGSGTPTPATLEASYDSHEGWTISGTEGSSYWILKSGASITSPSISDLSTVTSITFTARTYGGSSYNTVNVTTGSTSVGSATAGSKSMVNKTINVSGLTGSGSFVFSSSTTSSANGPGINNIVINYTTGGGSSTTYYTGTKDCTLPTEVTITFHKNDGTDATTSQTITYNTATALTVNTFSRTGYTFQGWATSATGTKAYDDEESVTLTKNTNLYAVWQKNSHNVSYSITPADKATATINSSATTPQSIEYGETVTLDITPDAEYNISSVTATGGVTLSGTGTQRTFTMPDNDVAISITLAAKPKYTVTWSANGSTTTEEYLEGASINFPATATGCDGKVFVGWSAVTVDETDTKPALVTSATMGTSPLTYYAVFAESSGASENEYVKGTSSDLQAGKRVLIVYHNSNKALSKVESGIGYAGVTVTPDGSGKVTTTNTNIIWTVSPQSSGYYFHQGDNYVNAGEASGGKHYLYVDEDPDAWTLTDGSVSGTYILHSSEDPGYQLEYYQDKFTIYTGTSGTAYEMDFYVPAASYSGYTTTCVQCDYKVTLTKGAEENGTFTLSKSNGTYNNCTSNFVVTVSGITPAEHYVCSGVTATGGNSTVTGPDGSGNYTVTYTKGNNITSTITANFTPESKYTVIWSQNGDDSNTAQYYEGDAIVFPSTASGCDGKVFRGWSTDPVAETDDEPTYVTSATMPDHDVTYYAVYATEGEGTGTATWEEAEITTLTSSDVFVIVGNGAYALPNDASSTPSVSSVTVSEGKITSTVGNTLTWNISGNGTDGYTFYPNGSTTEWLYSNTTAKSSSNTNIRVGTGEGSTVVRKVWKLDTNNQLVTKDTYTPRYLAVQGNSDWRGYVSATTSTTTITFYKQSGGVSYSGYTTACGASISAKNVGWITATKGQKVKRVITVSAKNFDEATTLSATCANSNFKVSLAATAVPDGAEGLTTTLTVEYIPTDFGTKDENVDIVLTAGDKTRTIKVNGRSLPEEFIIIAKQYSKWYAVPANMNSGSNPYDGVEVTPNTEPPTFVSIAPSTIIYSLRTVASERYNDAGNCVLLVGNDDRCLWANGSTNGTGIYNNNIVSKATDGHYEWLLATEDGAQYTISNPAHPDAAVGRRLANGGSGGTQFGLYKEATTFYIVPIGCSSQPQDVHVSAKRVDATFSWISNASSVTIDVYTNESMTEGHLSATATSSPYIFSGLKETTEYWYKLTPGTSTDCAVEGTFRTSGPVVDITEWKEDGVVLYIDKGDINPVIVIDGQEEHGSITGGGGNATELFFAKYFEGAGSMKLLSIFNGTNNAISLADYAFYDRHAGSGASSYGGDSEYDLSSLGSIAAGQEIIFFSRPESRQTPELAGCSSDFLTEVAKKSEPTDNPRWIECANGKFAGKTISFNGNDALLLKKNGTIIDVIGSLSKPASGSNCKGEDAWEGTIANMDYGKRPSDPAFTAFFDASSKSPVTTEDSTIILNAFGINLADKEINISTARCIFFRDNRVTSGDSAVNMNAGADFKTFTTHEEGGITYKSEWYGRSVCMTLDAANKAAAGVTSDAQATCNSYQDIANMDYNDYYIDYTSHIEPGQTLDHYTHDDETHLYTIPIDNLSNYTCLNIRFQLKKDGEVLTEESQQVPIIVSGSKTTKDDLFSKLVIDQETHLPSYSHSVERCKTCNVVVLADATLTKAADDDGSDVPQVSNVKVYPTGKLYVPSGTNYTVNSLSLRRQEDDVASAKIEGTLNVLTDDATYLDIRIDPTNWHYFTLPYDCNVSDIRFANEEETAIPQVGSDFLLCSYDGEHRAATKSTSWKDLTSTDVLKKGIGYIIAIPGDGKVQREFRFPMANSVLTEENDDKLIGDLHAWGGNDAELRPNHKGWNLIGNPYMMYYNLPTTTTPLAAGTLIHDPDEDPWLGHWVIKDGTGDDAATPLYYIVVPQDNGWSEYKQTTIGGFDMPPFTSYFVQLGGNPDENKGINFVTTNKEDGPSPVIRRAPAEDIVDNHEVWFGVDLINTDGESDETTLLMSDKFTNDYDMMRDLVKMRGTYYTYYTKPVLASRNNEGEMAFNALPDSTAAAGVPLNFYAAQDGQYRFTVSAHYPLDEVKEAYLYDNDKQAWYNLMTEDYLFDAKRGDNTTRFMLVVRVERKQPEITTSIDNLHKGLVLTTVNRTLMLSGLTNDADIYVYDVSGKLLDARMHYSSASGIFRTTVNTSGLYFVRVKTPDGQQTLETVVY